MNDIEVGKEIRTAIKKGDCARAIELIGADKAQLETMTVFGTWLHVAASFGKIEIVQFLVSAGVDINRRGGIADAAPMHEAASEGHIRIVEYLLSKGAGMDVSDPQRNPLFSAIYGGHLEIVKLMVDRGIDVHVQYTGGTMKGMDALEFARERGETEIADYLEAIK